MSIGWAPAPARLWRGARGLWEVVIGLEVHSAVAARTKLLSAASASGAGAAAPSAPNAAVSLFDAAHPGTLPSPSGACVEAAVRAAAALACAVAPAPAWSRKHYHYADLPHGFQVTHAGEQALATDGALDVDVPAAAQAAAPAPVAAPAAAGVRRRGGGGASAPAPAPAAAPPVAAALTSGTYPVRVRIARLQLEQDSGKSAHAGAWTTVDRNRAGVGLLEVVTAPDLRTAREAGAFLRSLQALLRTVGACEGAIEDGGMRCDVNVSVRAAGDTAWEAPRVELKNVASIRGVELAVESEAARQVALLEGRAADAAAQETSLAGAPPLSPAVRSETRVFDVGARKSTLLRVKEAVADYRVLPEPDLLPLFLSPEYVAAVAARMPAPPAAVRARMAAAHGLTDYDARVLVAAAGGAAAYYDDAAAAACAALGEAPLPRATVSAAEAAAAAAAAAGALSSLLPPTPRQAEAARATAAWLATELFARAGEARALADLLPAQRLGELAAAVVAGDVSGKAGKEVLAVMLGQVAAGTPAEPPLAIAAARGWRLDMAELELRAICTAAIADARAAPALAKFRAGNARAAGGIVALALDAAGPRASPALAARIIAELLGPAPPPAPRRPLA